MKKITMILLITLAFTLPAAGADFGLTIDAAPSVLWDTGDPLDLSGLTYTVKAALWGNGKISDELNFELQGGYTLKETRAFLLELDQLQLNGKFTKSELLPGTLSFKAGRLPFSEFSGKVFSHTGDGLSLELGLTSLSISAFAAYTGLLQAPACSILVSRSDIADQSLSPVPLFGPLGPPRLIEGAALTFPEIAGQQTLIISGLFQQDLRSDADLVATGSRVDTIYAGLGLMGPLPLLPSLFYSLYGYGNTGSYGSSTIWAFLAGGGINYFMPEFLSSRIAVDALYSSGDADHSEFYEGNTAGDSLAFVPLVPSQAGLIFTAQQTNLFYISGSFSMKPFNDSDILGIKNTLLLLKVTGFFRSTVGAISTGGVNTGSDELYLGTEADLTVLARFLSDLGCSLSGAVFVPSTAMQSATPQIKISAALSLSM